MKRKNIINLIQLVIIIVVFNSCQKPFSSKNYNNVNDLVTDLKLDVKMISQEDFKKVIDSKCKFNLLDCREIEQFDTACITGAINIPRGLAEFEARDKIQNRRLTLYIYSDNEQKSVLTACALKKVKYSDIIVIKDNWDSWKNKFPENIQLEPNAGKSTEAAVVVVEESGCGG